MSVFCFFHFSHSLVHWALSFSSWGVGSLIIEGLVGLTECSVYTSGLADSWHQGKGVWLIKIFLLDRSYSSEDFISFVWKGRMVLPGLGSQI